MRALVGDNVILSVDTQTSSDIGEAIVEWSRKDLAPDIVHLHENRRTIFEHQNPAYRGRTMLSAEDLEMGIISLKLPNVRQADEGNYTCLFKSKENKYFVQLLVGKIATGAASSPVITLEDYTSSGLVLDCRAKGWYPEPKLSWWNADGHLLPAVTMTSNQDPDRLYNISSTVEVEWESLSRPFTCRVHQELGLCSPSSQPLFFLFIGSSLCLGEAHTIRALVGDDVTLSVDTETSSDIGDDLIYWYRKDLDPDVVLLQENGRTAYEYQNLAYRDRTMLSAEDLVRGIISLKLFHVRLADEGKYNCFVRSRENAYSFQMSLLVGGASSPVTTIKHFNSHGVVLGCQADGWYPQPELSWWNADGLPLPAVTMNTTQDLDRLYNIFSTLEVEWESLSRPITCRVHHGLFNQTREREVYYSEGGRSVWDVTHWLMQEFYVKSSCIWSVST
uniref:Ig-like domain-containing protein n=1 Tax=Gadus morhua TaxID=8049 RepID=A0A8C5F4L6_GADMO